MSRLEMGTFDADELPGRDPDFSVDTGLDGATGAVRLDVWHEDGGTIVSPAGECYNDEPWVYDGIHGAKEVLEAYLALVLE